MTILLALVSSALYGVADFLGGMGSRRAPVVTVTAWFQVVGLVALVGYALVAPGVTRASDLAWGSAAGAAGGLGVTLLYRALASGTVSTAAPTISMIALSVPVLVGLARGERPGVLPLIGIALGAVAVVLISLNESQAGASNADGAREEQQRGAPGPSPTPAGATAPDRVRSPLPLAFASGVLIGLFLVFLGRVQSGASGWPLVAGRATASVCLFVVMLATRAPFRLAAAARPPMVGAALTDTTANVFYVLAAQRGALSVVATLISLAPATTVLLAQLVLRERLARAQKLGVGVALAAVVLLAQG